MASDAKASDGLPTGTKESQSGNPAVGRLSAESSSVSSHNLHKLDSKVAVPADKLKDPFAHLPEEEAEILKRQLDTPDVVANVKTLYRFATRNDLIIIIVSTICGIAGGSSMPLMTILFGNLTGTFKKFILGEITGKQFESDLSGFTLYFVYLGIAVFVTVYVSTLGFIYTGEHVTQQIRKNYLNAILRQNIAIFDKLGAGEITTRITSDTNLCQDAISEKIALTLYYLATFLSAFVIGFIKDWKLTLILTSSLVALSTGMTVGASFMVKYMKASLESYAQGGSLAEEVISSIRNAVAFHTQEKLARNYAKHLDVAKRFGILGNASLGGFLAWMMFCLFATYGLAFWQGTQFIIRGDTELNNVVTVVLAIIFGAFSLGHVGPNMQALTNGVAASKKIFAIIDRVSPMDPASKEGKRLENLEGTIEFKNISHIYPSRPEVKVVEGLNLVIPAGKTTALVGASGSGKSTLVGLVERFYEPTRGEVLLDGIDVRDLNLKWLREKIALVSQEPVLFAVSIFENIAHGLIGTEHANASPEKKKELVENAAKMANADSFIRNLPEGYDTHVGERGFLLSGGQKQRVAIARAIISDPKILLLDEATSALDTNSEGIVQRALDEAAKGRTTIAIAHRLSTIKNADNIVVMQNGKLIEQGTHDQLLDLKGAYYGLVEAQRIGSEITSSGDDEKADYDAPLEDIKRIDTEKLVPEEDEKIGLQRTQTGKSKSSVALENRKETEPFQYSLWSLIKMTALFNRKEKLLMFIGLIASMVSGAGNPVSAFLFAKCVLALSLPPDQYGKMSKDGKFYALMFFVLALTQLISNAAQGIVFGICKERLTKRARLESFRNILRQDIEFFDHEKNSAGSLTSFLSTETTHLAGLSGTTLGTILNVLTTLIASFALGLAFGWKLALVCIATTPILIGAGFSRFFILMKFERRSKEAYEGSAAYACEATAAIRTVASLTREDDVSKTYHDRLKLQLKASVRSVAGSTVLYACSQSLLFFIIALNFWYGGKLIGRGEYDMFQFFVVFVAITFGSQSAGTIFSFAPDMGKAKEAAQSIKTLFDRQPEIDTWSTEGEKVPSLEGSVEFRDVHFRYPTRPEQPVLRGLNLTVKPGQYVALCGASGCGKSTTIALLERFYNPLAGGIFVDGKEISKYNINEYRNHLALVSQEPTLYQGTIKENILLGADREDVSDAEVDKACKEANIYDFIQSLPEGYNTVCGAKGALLSGGQKQRIAIARALVRNPKILLLDEATSALDSSSEKVVQAALDVAAQGRTTIAVAHRLSTIQKADVIYVFDAGRIVESGTHQELLALRGRYSELVNLQSLDKTS